MAVRIETSRILISAPVGRVWEALTVPSLVKRWQYGSDLSTDWQIGSAIRFHSEWEGQVFEQWGTVLEFSPASCVRYSLFAPRPGLEDRPENYFTMTYRLEDREGSTMLKVKMEDSRPGTVEQDLVEDGSDNPVLKALKMVAENQSSNLDASLVP